MEQKICQSCGMPMGDLLEMGTNADHTENTDYCRFCYYDGHFTNDFTMDEMIQNCADMLERFNEDLDEDETLTREVAVATMKAYFPTLKRWKK